MKITTSTLINVILATILLTSVSFAFIPSAMAKKRFVVSPTGIDDTDNIQAAFDEAAEHPGSTVRLTPGDFKVSQVIAKDFDGYFVGAGIGKTTIDVPGPGSVPNYTPPDFVPSAGEPEAPGSAAMIVFEGGGNIKVSDMTFDITEEYPAELHRAIHGLDEIQMLDQIIYVTYRPPGIASPEEGVTVDNVEFRGYNPLYPKGVRIGLAFDGAMITPGVINPGDVGIVTSTPFTGTHSVTNCKFDTAIGVESAGLTNGELVIKKNDIDAAIGILVLDHDNSLFKISRNVVHSHDPIFQSGVGIAAWQRSGKPRTDRGSPFVRAPSAPSWILISDNTIHSIEGTDAVQVMDRVFAWWQVKALDVVISCNKIILDTAYWYGGIYGWSAQDVKVLFNVISGTGHAGIFMGFWGGLCTGWVIIGNNVKDLDAFVAHISLGPDTSDCIVVGRKSTNVLDEGTDNILVGVTEI